MTPGIGVTLNQAGLKKKTKKGYIQQRHHGRRKGEGNPQQGNKTHQVDALV